MEKSKIVFITGSTSGIGKAIAKKMAALGHRVIINGFGDASEIEALVEELSDLSSQKAAYFGTDMSKAEQIESMFEQIKTEIGSVDILINNAGIQHVAPIDEFPADKWEAIINLNLSSVFHTTKAVLPHMKKVGWGRVINIASAHSLAASPFKSAYVAAKHGVAGFTKAAALEVAQDGITVNAISPGYVLTPLVEAQIPDTAKARNLSEEEVVRDVILAAQPTKAFIEAEDIAETAAYLCSDAAKGITGSNISMDGGWTAK
ncbi:MAG: 3-hydroxybutyrate dehydrogenase [Nitratireductor sp.]